MSDATVNDTLSDSSDLSELSEVTPAAVEASIVWRTGRPAPEVVLAFDGIEVPAGMLGSLASLGWRTPALPSPPRTAIEWIPDPIAGTDYTIRPWRVTAYVLGAGEWDRETASAIAVHTMAILHQHDAKIEAPDELMAELGGRSGSGEAVAAETTPTGRSGPAAVEGGSTAPQVIALAPAGLSHPAFAQRTAVGGGRNRVEIMWAESATDLQTTLPSDAELAATATEAAHLWTVRYETRPKLPGVGYVALCAAVPGTSADDKKLRKLASALGGSIQVAELVPVDPTSDCAGALVFGIVPAQGADIAASMLRLKCKTAFVRTEAT